MARKGSMSPREPKEISKILSMAPVAVIGTAVSGAAGISASGTGIGRATLSLVLLLEVNSSAHQHGYNR